MTDHEMTDPAGGALTITHDHQGVWITATEDRDEVTVGPFPTRTLRASFDMGDDLMDGGVTAAAIEAEVDGMAVWKKTRTDRLSPEQARSLVQERDEALTHAAETIATAQAETTAAVTAQEKAEQERDEALAFATLWKRTAREQIRRTRLIAGRTQVQADYIGRLRREVEKARQQGDVDPLPIIDEVARQDGVIHDLRAQLDQQKNPRPLTADDITAEAVDDAMIQRGVAEARRQAAGMCILPEIMADILMAALTPPPSRPEGAGEIEATLFEWNQMDDHGNYALDPEIITELSDHLARSFPVGSDS